MVLCRFMLWLLGLGDALVARWAALIQRRRWQVAKEQLPRGAREKAAFWRARYLAREARLQCERDARRSARASHAHGSTAPQDISKADVLAAIARSRLSREARRKAAPKNDGETL